MRKIARQLRDFCKEDFHWPIYLATLVFLIVCLVINYSTGFMRKQIYGQADGWGKFASWMGFMLLPYLVVIGLQAAFGRSGEGTKKFGFWAMLLVAMLMVSATACFPWHKDIAKLYFPKDLYKWAVAVLWNLKRLALMLPPMFLFWLAFDRKHSKFYGLFTRPVNLGPYFALLLIMLPLIVFASFRPDFLKTYPQYQPGKGEIAAGISPWLTAGIFEFVYGADFVFVELLFRGFLVIGFVRWLGPRAVLPMVSMYCFLHFGKPAFEAGASIVAGFILGVVAYYNRSIWGGIVVHLGTAWMMEGAAYWQKMW